jgi:ATP-dependent protease ClpP protease subunit
MKKLYFLVILLTLAKISFAGTLYHSVGINFTVIENDNELLLQLHDVIQHPAAVEFQDSYMFLSKTKPVIIDLNSGGGSTEEGNKIIAFVNMLKSEGFDVRTRIQNGRMCGSMCVPVFLSADTREAGETSAFMFHGVTVGWSTVPDRLKTLNLFEYMKSRGLTHDFEKFLWEQEALSLSGEYWLSGSEMMALNSGVITQILNRHVLRKKITMPYYPKL